MRNLALALAALASTAALIWFGTGLAPEWPLMWIAPVPVLLYALNAGAGAAALIAGAAMILGLTNLWSYLHGSLSVPLAILVRIYLIEGVVFALAVLLFRALAGRRAYWSALLAFPAALVSFEWFLNLTSPHGTAASLAYSQLAFLPFLQLASITGPWGMSFLLLIFPTALVLASHLRKESTKEGYRILGVTAAVVIAVLIFGSVRLLSPPPAGSLVKVGLVAYDGPNERVADDGAPAEQLFKDYAARVAQLAQQGAAVVVLPEKTAVVVDADLARTDSEFQSLADANRVRVVVGVLRVSPPGAAHPQKLRYNEARVYTPGEPVASYDKEHMLPPFESNLTPGTTLTLLHSSAGRGLWGVAICKDMDFTQLSRQYGAAGAGLMLVPGWDFFADAVSHGHMAIMRGVESGFGVVRSAKGGSLYVSDNRGRIMAEISSDAVPFTALLASVPETHDRTLFLSLGDWFAWVAVATLVLCLVRLTESRARARPRRPLHRAAKAEASVAEGLVFLVASGGFVGGLGTSGLRRAALEQGLREQRLGRVAGARLDPAEGGFERCGAPEHMAVRARDFPRCERVAVAAIAHDARDALDAHAPGVRLDLLDTAFHGTSPMTSLQPRPRLARAAVARARA